MKFTCRIALPLCLALTLISFHQPDACAQSLDQVVAGGGVPIEGTITDMNKRQVTLTKNSQRKAFEVNAIKRVSFADDPSEMKRIRRSVSEGRFKDAMNELDKIDLATVKVAFVNQDVRFYKAYVSSKLALQGEGEINAAASSMLDFLKQNQNNFHYYQGLEMIGDLAYASGNFKFAEVKFEELATAPWPEYKVQATLRQAKAQLAQDDKDKIAEALQNFEKVMGSSAEYEGHEEHKQYAQFGKAICMAGSGQAEQAITMVETVIRDNDPKNMSLFGQAYNALGACYMKAGKHKEALLAYLHTDILFFGDADTHAEALYYLNYLWAKENQSDRAVRAAGVLSSRYGGSIWATRPKMQ